MKKQLQKMSGSALVSADDWPLELRKFAIMNVDSSNFESVNLEQLKALSDKSIKLQKLEIIGNTPLTKMEMFFTNGLESAAYKCADYNSQLKKHEGTFDTSKLIKKISVKMDTGAVKGLKFLDE